MPLGLGKLAAGWQKPAPKLLQSLMEVPRPHGFLKLLLLLLLGCRPLAPPAETLQRRRLQAGGLLL